MLNVQNAILNENILHFYSDFKVYFLKTCANVGSNFGICFNKKYAAYYKKHLYAVVFQQIFVRNLQ